jgi:RND family efflux transporter MFP subunit
VSRLLAQKRKQAAHPVFVVLVCIANRHAICFTFFSRIRYNPFCMRTPTATGPFPLFRTALLTLCCAALTACTINSPIEITPTPLSRAPTAIPPTYSVALGPVVKRLQFSARVQPKETADLYFETDGRVLKVPFKDGATVKQGDVLAELDVTDLRNELEQRKVEFETAQTVLSNTLKGYTRTLAASQLDIEQAGLRLQIASQQAGDAEVKLAQNDLNRNQRQIDAINFSIKSAREAFDQSGADNAAKLLEEAQLDRARLQAAYERAVSNQKVATLQVALLDRDLKRAQLAYQNVLADIDPNVVSNVERTRLAYEGAQKRLGRSTLIAPFDGVIAQQTARVGSTVRALDPLIKLAKPGELVTVGTLNPVQASQVDISAAVTCFFDNAPNSAINGIVGAFPKMPQDAQNQIINIQFGKDTKLEISRLARCSTVLGEAQNVLWLPPPAVRAFQGRRFVVMPGENGARRRIDIEVGLESDERIEIKRGLKEGDVVVGP